MAKGYGTDLDFRSRAGAHGLDEWVRDGVNGME